MAETNGGGRLDRIEASLEKAGERLNELTEKFHMMVEHHEAEFKHLMTWQVLMQDKMDKAEAARLQDREEAARERQRLNQLNEITDRRIADLVGAIMRIVPPA
jgi:uncharacterized protein YaaN involved in tellurite resistance